MIKFSLIFRADLPAMCCSTTISRSYGRSPSVANRAKRAMTTHYPYPCLELDYVSKAKVIVGSHTRGRLRTFFSWLSISMEGWSTCSHGAEQTKMCPWILWQAAHCSMLDTQYWLSSSSSSSSHVPAIALFEFLKQHCRYDISFPFIGSNAHIGLCNLSRVRFNKWKAEQPWTRWTAL